MGGMWGLKREGRRKERERDKGLAPRQIETKRLPGTSDTLLYFSTAARSSGGQGFAFKI
jgi:hypothetical protein